MGQVGSAQKRALVALVESPNGVGEVPFLNAPGLINRGLVRALGRACPKPNAPYVCAITAAGRRFLAELPERERASSAGPADHARQNGQVA